jgi:membrane-associated protease RseP (regulator of RpoE activity)
VSLRDFSPPPYPDYAQQYATPESGNGYAGTGVRSKQRYWLHGLLLLLTLLTTTLLGVALQYDFDRNLPVEARQIFFEVYERVWYHPVELLEGLPFSLTLITILLAHEVGHYLAAAYYRVDASLPYFLPAPTLIGTFGAFIRIRSAIYSKRALFDIGVAGPLAGFVFLLPALSVGLAFSKVVPGIGHQGDVHFGVPLLQWLLQRTIFPGTGAGDVYLHPVGRAASIGMFATALNLLPIGQLDGGHIVYALAERKHRAISNLALVALVPLTPFWPAWLFWALILFLFGRRHPVVYDLSDLGRGRYQLGWIALAVFILCFTFAPVGT